MKKILGLVIAFVLAINLFNVTNIGSAATSKGKKIKGVWAEDIKGSIKVTNELQIKKVNGEYAPVPAIYYKNKQIWSGKGYIEDNGYVEAILTPSNEFYLIYSTHIGAGNSVTLVAVNKSGIVLSKTKFVNQVGLDYGLDLPNKLTIGIERYNKKWNDSMPYSEQHTGIYDMKDYQLNGGKLKLIKKYVKKY